MYYRGLKTILEDKIMEELADIVGLPLGAVNL